jgi:hypothetical protein
VLAFAYLVAYSIASYLDLSTTALALRQSQVHEQNVFVTAGSSYLSLRAWAITFLGGIFMVGCVAFAFLNAPRVEQTWLEHPGRSFALFYINPWSQAAIGRSPLHMLSFAMAFVVLRLMAAGNNLSIHWYGIAPIGLPIEWIGRRSSPVIGFAAVLIPLFYLLSLALSRPAARIISSWQGELRRLPDW